MSHHIYHTEGFVLESRNTGEANRMITIYTRELGMIRASAQGIRHLKSKLRYALSDFSYAKIDFVRGKEIWRITSATPLPLLDNSLKDKKLIAIIASISKLMVRLCPGEEANEALFEHLTQSLNLLEQESFEERNLKNAELLIVLRILYHLGYLNLATREDSMIRSPLTFSLLSEIEGIRKELLMHINESLKETQL